MPKLERFKEKLQSDSTTFFSFANRLDHQEKMSFSKFLSYWIEFKELMTFHILEFKDADGNITFHLDTWMILVTVISYFLLRFLLKFTERSVTRKMPDHTKMKYRTIFRFINLFAYSIVMILVLHSTGMKITGLIAASAAIFIGIGLALQDLLKDIIAGVAILIDKSIMVNDIVEVDDKVAKVYEVNIRTTRAITRNDKILIIPNHLFLTNTIYNYTQNDTSTREEVKVGVAYGSDTEKVKQVLLACADRHEKVLGFPEPVVKFMDFGASSLDFSLFFYIKDAFISPKIKSDLRFLINDAFEKENISIPFPQRDIRIIKEEG